MMKVHFWPKPWRYEPEGYCEGPCVNAADDQVICAFFWPAHPVDETSAAENMVAEFGREVAALAEIDG
jgi:hypothetical protein